MNNKYKVIYLSDKSYPYIQIIPQGELKPATKGLEKIHDDDNVEVWDGSEYQVIALKQETATEILGKTKSKPFKDIWKKL